MALALLRARGLLAAATQHGGPTASLPGATSVRRAASGSAPDAAAAQALPPLYAVLGVPRGASQADIKHAFRRRAKVGDALWGGQAARVTRWPRRRAGRSGPAHNRACSQRPAAPPCPHRMRPLRLRHPCRRPHHPPAPQEVHPDVCAPRGAHSGGTAAGAAAAAADGEAAAAFLRLVEAYEVLSDLDRCAWARRMGRVHAVGAWGRRMGRARRACQVHAAHAAAGAAPPGACDAWGRGRGRQPAAYLPRPPASHPPTRRESLQAEGI